MKREESNLQQNCVRWFDYQYAQYRLLLFAIPNGGYRSKPEAGVLKAEGVRPGVADMFLAKESAWVKEDVTVLNGLFIEFKTEKGKQCPEQKEFEVAVKAAGYGYEVVRDFDTFKKLITEYMPEIKPQYPWVKKI